MRINHVLDVLIILDGGSKASVFFFFFFFDQVFLLVVSVYSNGFSCSHHIDYYAPILAIMLSWLNL
jgi:hypothetical protein